MTNLRTWELTLIFPDNTEHKIPEPGTDLEDMVSETMEQYPDHEEPSTWALSNDLMEETEGDLNDEGREVLQGMLELLNDPDVPSEAVLAWRKLRGHIDLQSVGEAWTGFCRAKEVVKEAFQDYDWDWLEVQLGLEESHYEQMDVVRFDYFECDGYYYLNI